MRTRRRSSGFTLVELAVATSIASVALVTTAGTIASTGRLARVLAETRTAARASTAVMERIRATPFSQISATFGNTTQTFAAIAQSQGLAAAGNDSSGTATVAVTDVATGSARWAVKQVTVTTRWRGVNGDTTRTFVTWVSDRAAGSALGSASVIN